MKKQDKTIKAEKEIIRPYESTPKDDHELQDMIITFQNTSETIRKNTTKVKLYLYEDESAEEKWGRYKVANSMIYNEVKNYPTKKSITPELQLLIVLIGIIVSAVIATLKD